MNLELGFFSWLAVSKPYRSSLLPLVLGLLSCMGVALLVAAASVLLSSPTASLFKRLFSHHYSNQILILVCSQDFTIVSFSFRVHLLGSAPKSSNIICLTFFLNIFNIYLFHSICLLSSVLTSSVLYKLLLISNILYCCHCFLSCFYTISPGLCLLSRLVSIPSTLTSV